ncbi:hypothetical protein AB9K32_07760 [Allomuricauda sp. XS_ASV26]|uniref:hypothetical protein n=1 Tax=Allomuricauda sp. XS_ASV26 TaxID=3241292 RepID=UPI003518F174
MGNKTMDFDYPLIIYNEMVTTAKNKSTVDYEHLILLTRNVFTREEIDGILLGHCISDLEIGKPELWVLVRENGSELPSNDYFEFLLSQQLMLPAENREEVYKRQLNKAYEYWPKRKRTGKKKRNL